jgi:methanogenic corrinoid protein MtbC1
VLVGGYPFNISSNLWRKVGADATASDALEAVKIGEQLLA